MANVHVICNSQELSASDVASGDVNRVGKIAPFSAETTPPCADLSTHSLYLPSLPFLTFCFTVTKQS